MKNMTIRRPSNRFGREPQVKVGRSQFDRSHGRKTMFDASYLYPIFVDEVLPGDTMTMSLNGLVRVHSPLDAPIMDDIKGDVAFFFVPCRLLWVNWRYFMGEHTSAGAQDTTYTVPILDTGLTVDHDGLAYDVHALAAHFGLPEGLTSAAVEINSLPFRAYNMIWSQWYRDQAVESEPYFGGSGTPGSDGPDTVSWFALRKSAKVHDYFTSALPYLQKGTASTVALSGSLDVRMTDGTTGDFPSIYADDAGQYRFLEHSGVADERVDVDATQDATGSEKLYVNLSDAGTVDINDLRYAVAIQRLLEKDARGGTRYTEILNAHFGVTSSDHRMQRPEYLGGGRFYVNVSAVSTTTSVDSTAHPGSTDEYAGELRGVAAGTIRGCGFAKSFEEHGYIIGLIRCRGQVTYHQGVDRMWSRSAKTDFYWPELAFLGEQAVLNKEIYNSNSSATDDAVFGYVPRWEEYRFKKSEIIGKFSPNVTGNLAHWHLAEDFAALPTLNATFIQDQTPMSRVKTFDTEPDFMADIWFNYKCARPLPVHSIPKLTGGRF